MPIKTISEPIYQSTIHFIFDTPKEKALKYIKSHGFNPLDFDRHFENAGFLYGDERDCFLVLPNRKPTWAVTTIIAHESFHATCKVLRAKGLDLSPESEEAFNYYQTWIIQALTDIYNDHFKRPSMKAKAKSVTKAELKKVMKKDKKDDMKMIKKAIKNTKHK